MVSEPRTAHPMGWWEEIPSHFKGHDIRYEVNILVIEYVFWTKIQRQRPYLPSRSSKIGGSLHFSNMGSDEIYEEVQKNEEKTHDTQAICLHAFSDLSRILPPMFVALLKACYVRGTEKATKKFQVLQQQVLLVLQNSPQPGPVTFVVQCLYVFPILGHLYTEGFSHLVTSSLRRLQTTQTIPAESEAKRLAAQLFLDVIGGIVSHEGRILMKLLEVVDVRLENLREVICGPGVNDDNFDRAKACIEPYIFGLIESQSYMMAVTLLERFSIRQLGQEFLMRMMQENQFQAAEKWAAFMGKPMLCILIQKYIDMKLLKNAYELIKKNNLLQEFPEVYHMYKECSLKKLAEKGCWDVAEVKTNNDKQLLEYLVYLAMEAGYSEKVDELCERYALDGFVEAQEPQANATDTHFLHLNELVLEDIKWVDEVDGLHSATSLIEECKVVGVDCEWKPNYVKGSKPNKVSIMQIASEKTVFIFDLIKLFEVEPKVLDSCLKRILHSPSILKLGYNLQCDLNQLSHSYGELECFKHYEMLLDIQNVYKEPRGGLSGLAKKILGASLNKTRRNSNWEQRPLSQYQMEYAALDAAVLIHIFRHVRNQPQSSGVNNGQPKMEWKSHIVSHMDDNKKHKPKKTPKAKSKKKVHSGTNLSFN
ncbi:3'-5' exonuclease domain [Macleaya cordata]|uniref:3'-5' exonuclease domain n=1 Tax=Macleaya cordata TaxID=56857 RepID=A0A200PWH0_MACCD|nr:3'-5' exonuclease domain [Macleaya cordata]